MKIEDCRKIKDMGVDLTLVPGGTVFLGKIGAVDGCFKRNQGHVFQLDGTAIFQVPAKYSVTERVYNYQPVHGRIVIERNA